MADPNATDEQGRAEGGGGGPERRRLGRNALLVVSLALNLLVIAAIAGAAWRHNAAEEASRPGGKRGPDGGIAYLRAMEKPDRRAVLKAARQAGRASGFDRSAHEAEMIAILREEQFDIGAFDTLLAAQNAAVEARIAAFSAAWRAQVLEMSPQARADYADRIAQIAARRAERKAEAAREAGE